MVGVGAQDRPADLRLPLVLVWGVERVAEVGLAQGSVDAELVATGVGAERAVRDVDVRQWAVVGGDRELRAGDDERLDAPDGLDRPRDGDVDDRVAAIVLEDLGRVEPAAGPGGVQALPVDDCVQLAERASPPDQEVIAVDGVADRDRRGGGNRPVLDSQRGVGALEQVA